MVGRLRDFLPAAGICKAFRRQGASPDLNFPYLVWRMRQPPSPPIIRTRAKAVLKPPPSKRWRPGVRPAILAQRRGLRHPLALWPLARRQMVFFAVGHALKLRHHVAGVVFDFDDVKTHFEILGYLARFAP